MRKFLISIISVVVISIAMTMVAVAYTGNGTNIFSEGFKSKAENLGEIPSEVKEKLEELIITVSQAKENVNVYAERLAKGEVAKNESKKNPDAKAKAKADIVAKALEEGKAEAVIKEIEKEQPAETQAQVETKAEMQPETPAEAQPETQSTQETSARSYSQTTTKQEKPIEIREDSSNQNGIDLNSITYEKVMSADSATQRSIARQFNSSEEYMDWLEKKKSASGVKDGSMNESYEAILGQ